MLVLEPSAYRGVLFRAAGSWLRLPGLRPAPLGGVGLGRSACLVGCLSHCPRSVLGMRWFSGPGGRAVVFPDGLYWGRPCWAVIVLPPGGDEVIRRWSFSEGGAVKEAYRQISPSAAGGRGGLFV